MISLFSISFNLLSSDSIDSPFFEFFIVGSICQPLMTPAGPKCPAVSYLLPMLFGYEDGGP
jgi:hypothetical protein